MWAYFDEPNSTEPTEDEIKTLFPPTPGRRKLTDDAKVLATKMLKERKSIGGGRAKLEKAGIYYFKLNQEVDFPDPPNTKISCHYVGKSVNVYKRMKEHINVTEKICAIDKLLAKCPPTEYVREWTFRAVMLDEIPVHQIKELRAIKDDMDAVLSVLENTGIMKMKSLYPKGYNMRLDMPPSMTYVDHLFTF